MNSLPEVVFFGILEFLTARDVFVSIIRMNKQMHEAIKASPYILGLVCRLELKMSRELRLSYSETSRILQHLWSSKQKNLDFYGFGTSGGYDDNRFQYWVSNMYVDDGSAYCSRDAKNNINTVGVLSATQSNLKSKEEFDYLIKVFEKCPDIGTFIRPPYKNNQKLSHNQASSLKNIYITYKRDLIRHISTKTQESLEKVEEQLEACFKNEGVITVSQEWFRRPDDLYVIIQPISHESVTTGNLFGIIDKVELSRDGAFTCPVDNFLIFVSEVYLDIEDEEFNRYNDLTSSEKVDEVLPGETREVVKGQGFVYKEFYWTRKTLKPVIWGKFTERACRRAVAALKERFLGNYLYTKLINPDNRMAEMNDMHDTTNIDCDCVLAYGVIVDLNPNN